MQHLECPEGTPSENAFDEMVCAGCMRKHEFLWRYAPKNTVSKDSKKDSSDSKEEDKVEISSLPHGCTMPEKIPEQKNTGSCFWVEGWRSNLCVCSDCKEIYEKEEVSFLLDPLDSVQAYEEAGKSNPRETQYEKGMRALASLDHVQQIDAIEGTKKSNKIIHPVNSDTHR